MPGNLALIISITTILAALLRCIGAGDTLLKGEPLTGNQSLTSNNGLFELGFRKFDISTNRFYLCIRYTQVETTVWVANRDKPLPDETGSKLEIASNGILQLSNGPDLFWSSSSSSSPESVAAVLDDNGNLILRNGSGDSVWESFDHPTDTWLTGARLGGRRQLVSWRNEVDPSPGDFSAEISPESTIVFRWKQQLDVYWESPRLESWAMVFLNTAEVIRFKEQGNGTALLTSPGNPYHPVLKMHHREGKLKLTSSGVASGFSLPDDDPFCGAYAIRTSPFSNPLGNPCPCLQPGFSLLTRPNLMGPSCDRDTSLPCENSNGKGEKFEKISGISWPYQPKPIRDGGGSDKECERACRRNCSCTAYAFDGTQCFVWEGDLYGIERLGKNQTLHLKLAQVVYSGGKSNKTKELIMSIVIPVVVLLCGAFLGFFYNNRRTKHNEVTTEAGEDLLSFDFNLTNDGTILRTRSNMETDLPIFSYSSVSAATNNFSTQNKLGEGGFGPVYKGELQNGQEIAIKRLSQKSGQGFEEFRNEILLIAKLQHRNLVRLLGCCIDPIESILIYEYMPNKSLDFFLFGSNKKEILDWKTRTHIIEGIAQGLLYLHEYSRLRIIHRDLKASNILLDDEMNPKISDFGMARIFGGTDSMGYTNRVVGTFGYIAPEYALEGLFSTKSDVYSFGVMVLEIISGKKNTGFYKTDSLHLLGFAWDLWISGRGVELVEGKVGALVAASAALRYINVGLLCVQENPNDRPNMSSVVSMLCSEIAVLPTPKKPAFATTNSLTSYSSKMKGGGDPSYPSVNHLSVSDFLPR